MTLLEEVVSALNYVVRTGKVRAIGLSDVPAWYFAKAQTLAELRAKLDAASALEAVHPYIFF